MLKTLLTYTCAECGAEESRDIPAGAHPYAASAFPAGWHHLPMGRREDDRVFCTKSACQQAAQTARAERDVARANQETEAAAKYQEFLEQRRQRDGVHPEWRLSKEDAQLVLRLQRVAVRSALASAPGTALQNRQQQFSLWSYFKDKAAELQEILAKSAPEAERGLLEQVKAWQAANS